MCIVFNLFFLHGRWDLLDHSHVPVLPNWPAATHAISSMQFWQNPLRCNKKNKIITKTMFVNNNKLTNKQTKKRFTAIFSRGWYRWKFAHPGNPEELSAENSPRGLVFFFWKRVLLVIWIFGCCALCELGYGRHYI